MIKILLLIDYSSEFSRKLLRGLVQYSQDHGPWIFYRLPSYYKVLHGKQGVIEWVKEKKPDAIIAQWDHEGSNLLKDLDIPIILQNFKSRSDYFSNLTGDYIGTGRMAAKFFIERKFRNFAFYGNKGVVWSRERAEGFTQEVIKAGGNYFYFESERLNENEWNNNHIKLDEWLTSLPKPVALFACDDRFALEVSEICKINNINIPDEISLLGVDNDELICNLSDPPISSIMLQVEKGGYDAGNLIHRQIREKKNTPFNIIINPVKIIERKSTDKYNIENKYILAVLRYIEENYNADLSIDSLIKIVPLSRRNLEVKFKNELGCSIYQFILKFRIEHFEKLLINTERSLFDIALECGFTDSKNISRVFKKMKGLSPTEYKKRYLKKQVK
ncbi:LacI family transcriptional regulator [Bacteroides zoogleoformans]|uniref:Transcriptional regulator n=1 Tax=Bacteroides zoogleoformans TaxID=28119 RepID=A0ABM6T8Y3_9BACE|nr:DNA-binding transcriptional regulator [Bacteroides zoogleoformans]AVM53229.1 transcriptional regulator [Bacteroides zoogleoformans]TWJ17833.1 LacI family transcriptional regulator [Bacteroides zoogleoformans]